MNPKGKSPGRGDSEEPRRRIGAGTARSAAARLRAVRIALAHELIRVGRILDRRGMIVATEGSLSARVSSDRVLITRRGRRKGEMTPRDFVELGVLEPADSAARLAASTDHRVHLVGYAVRREVEAIVQAHPAALTAFALRGCAPDLSKIDEAVTLLGTIGFVRYRPAGSEDLAEAVAAALDPPGPVPRPHVLVLQNQGALTVGTNVDEALARLEVAEHLAAAVLMSERGGTR
jgi:L-fuculose-phosphate aldolase